MASVRASAQTHIKQTLYIEQADNTHTHRIVPQHTFISCPGRQIVDRWGRGRGDRSSHWEARMKADEIGVWLHIQKLYYLLDAPDFRGKGSDFPLPKRRAWVSRLYHKLARNL